MTNPQQEYNDPQQQQWGQQPPPKKRKKWPFVLGGLVLLIIIISVSNRGGDSTTSTTSAPGSTSSAPEQQPSADAPPAFPGATSNDKAVPAGATADVDGLSLTATPIKAGSSVLGKTLCTQVTYANGTDRPVTFNSFDWKLQDPGGAARTTGFSGSDSQLSSGDLAPGGKVTGDVCFDNKSGGVGQFVLLYDSSFFSSDRVAWLNMVG